MSFFLFFFFNDTATTEIYTLSLHDALPIYIARKRRDAIPFQRLFHVLGHAGAALIQHRKIEGAVDRSEEHTSELQSHSDLVCRLLLEKKNNNDLLVLGPRKSYLMYLVHIRQ